MPIGLAGASIIGAGANLAGGMFSGLSQGRQNRKSREFSERMYNQQRDDNIDFWHMQNSYNDPSNQMSRLRDAGLNPNLVYGKGGASAGQAGSISSPSVVKPEFGATGGEFIANAGTSYLHTMYDLDLKKQQSNNLQKQNDVLIAEKGLKAANTVLSRRNSARAGFDLKLAKDLRSTSLEAANEAVRQSKVNTDIALTEEQRKAAMHSKNMQEAAERILSAQLGRKEAKARIKNLGLDSKLKALDHQLWQDGISRNDPMWMRMLHTMIKKALGEKAKDLFNPFKN